MTGTLVPQVRRRAAPVPVRAKVLAEPALHPAPAAGIAPPAGRPAEDAR